MNEPVPSTDKRLVALSDTISNDRIELVEADLLSRSQIDCPLTHHFAPGVYMREILMPAGTFIIGHEHKTDHFNIILSGRAMAMISGKYFTLEAPASFRSEPGVRKVLFIQEDMRWITVHPTHETDLEKLADELIVKSQSFAKYHGDLEQLKKLISAQ